jgi:predicted transcriptional regulator
MFVWVLPRLPPRPKSTVSATRPTYPQHLEDHSKHPTVAGLRCSRLLGVHLDDDRAHDQPPIGRRVTVKEAAELLGISPEAVRARIKRGTLHKEKGADGAVYVRLDDDRTSDRTSVHDELVEELRDRVRYLEEESRRKDSIILTMAQRIPELEAPAEPRESPESVGETPDSTNPRSATKEPQETTSRPQEERSWWRRWFGA